MRFKGIFSYSAILILCLFFIMIGLHKGSAESKTIIPNRTLYVPYDVFLAKDTKTDTSKFRCEKAPRPIKDLVLTRYYKESDSTKSIVDPALYKKHQKQRAPLRSFENTLLRMTNRYVEGGMKREDVAECAINWLYQWAKKDALLGDTNKTGEHLQKWTLGVVANGYAQIMYSPSISVKQRKVIERWLKEYAYKVKSIYSQNTHLPSRNNNHLYWAAWSVGMSAAVLENKELYNWAIDRAVYGVNQIKSDGTLPLEMERGARALNYHVFAAHPLVMMAALSVVNNGIDLYKVNNGRLLKLINISLQSLNDPSFFVSRTGKKQDAHLIKNNSALAWVEVFSKQYQDDLADKYLRKYRPMKQTRTGGNISLLYSGGLIKHFTSDTQNNKKYYEFNE